MVRITVSMFMCISLSSNITNARPRNIPMLIGHIRLVTALHDAVEGRHGLWSGECNASGALVTD